MNTLVISLKLVNKPFPVKLNKNADILLGLLRGYVNVFSKFSNPTSFSRFIYFQKFRGRPVYRICLSSSLYRLSTVFCSIKFSK